VGIKEELAQLEVLPEVNLDQRRRVLFFHPFPAATAELARWCNSPPPLHPSLIPLALASAQTLCTL
jgi:hypothetical protein